MAVYGSIEELISMLENYKSKDYVEYKFTHWLDIYPGILEIMLNYRYNELFDDAIKKNMDKVLSKIIREGEFYRIHDLSYKYPKEIFENIDIILDEDPHYREDFCDLVHLKGFEECALTNQEKILKRALEFNEYHSPTDYTSNLLFLLSALPFFEPDFASRNKEIIENFLITNFSIIEPECYGKDLLFLFETLVMSSKNHTFIKAFLNKHIEIIAIVFANRKLNTLKQENVLDFYVELIKDVMRIEGADITDMKLKKGANSRALIIKDKVIKSGSKCTNEIPYHRRLLQPTVRQSIKHKKDNLQSSFFKNLDLEFDFVEVYERTNDVSNNSNDLVYNIFKEMLEDGVLWTDPSIDNLGILLKPNLPFHEPTGYNDEKFYIDDEAVGIYDSSNPKEVLAKGEIVVRDLDPLYYFGNLRGFIESKLAKNEKVNSYSLLELYGWSKITLCSSFDIFLNKYVEDLKKQMENGKKL